MSNLKLIEKNLISNGILIFTTFNIDSIFAKIMKGKYHWIMPMHKFYFSNSTLKFFLKSNKSFQGILLGKTKRSYIRTPVFV